jgi:thiopeptide-type bacteriocin biosynthesis protein
MLDALFADLVRRGHVTSVRPSVYEPEARQFGGPRAMAAVHDWFYADSVTWILWARLGGRERPGRTEMAAGAVLSDLFAEALRDGAEVWDVWHNLGALTGDAGRTTSEARIEPVSLQHLDGWASPAERAVLRRYRAPNRRLAAALRQIWADGDLAAGMRTVLAFVAMFHCNRLGIDGRCQAALAHAMARAWDPRRALRGGETPTVC